MKFKEKFKSSVNSLAEKEEKIVQIFMNADVVELIDNTRSDIYKNDNFIVFKFFSKGNLCCPIYISFGRRKYQNKVSFSFNANARILDLLDILDKKEFEYAIDSIYNLLKSEVKEELTYVKGKVAKGKYHYSIDIDGHREIIPYFGYNRIVWPWEKKEVIKQHYEPWLKNNNKNLQKS